MVKGENGLLGHIMTVFHPRVCYALLLMLAAGLSGCLSPITLESAAMGYDQATADTVSRQLLLNIARARQHLPIHFTGVTNIAATFNFQFTAGATPALTGSAGSTMLPIFGGTVSENPTIAIVPMEGEEFTKRLLAPFQENKLTMLLRQGVDVDLLLRLMAGEFRADSKGQGVPYFNKPSDRAGYRVFRQVVLHLSSIQDRNGLYVEPLVFERQWTIPADCMSPEDLKSLQHDFNVNYAEKERLYRLEKRQVGRLLITNYDPASLSDEERARLHEEADKSPPDEISVDIRPGYPGGEYPIKGRFRLRSFHNVLNFLGRGLGDEPEYDVGKDPRTPLVSENPANTLNLLESDDSPEGVEVEIELNGWHYALKPDHGYPWNREAFRLLYQLFQMTMTELPQFGIPITISK